MSEIVQLKTLHKLLSMTYDFNMDYDLDIKPIANNKEHFNKWVGIYPFYSNIEREGVSKAIWRRITKREHTSIWRCIVLKLQRVI